MATSIGKTYDRPIFTIDDLNRIEDELEKDGEYIEVRDRQGNPLKTKNAFRGEGRSDPPPFAWAPRNQAKFGRERELDEWRAEGIEAFYGSVRVGSFQKWGPRVSASFAEGKMIKVIMDWEFSDECRNLIDALWSMDIPQVDKIIAFGGGSIAINNTAYELEHAMFLTVARVLGEKQGGKKIPVYVQEPAYTAVCKEVLPKFGFNVIDCFGARGLTMIDNNTVVLVHFPAFAIRQIVADLGVRPAAMFWKPEITEAEWEGLSKYDKDNWHDVDTAKTREMMHQYTRVDLPGAKITQTSFYKLLDVYDFNHHDVFIGSTWYVRNQTS
ncbi:hypothetical protein K449DRAFT_462076 [Hypoxylon sp. EC38]|nr:hypothetical protein K449DRAFT_462076 [Hypoxylon sp. EC38]